MDGPGGSPHRYLGQGWDIGQRYANLLKPIRDQTKNFDIDIAPYLDQYLGEICQSRTTDQESESKVNFTRAAFLIQGSASVYSRKVDYLYNLVQNLAEEIVHNSLKSRHKKENVKEGGASAARRKKNDTQFVMHEDIKHADSIDDVTTSRQAAGNQAIAQQNQFRRQRWRPLPMVVFDTEEENRLYDIAGAAVGSRFGYRLYGGAYELGERQNEQSKCAQADYSSLTMSPAGSTLAMDYDCGPASPLFTPEEPETVPFGKDIWTIEECPAKSDVEEDLTVPVPPVWQSSLAKHIMNEQQQQHPTQPFIGIKRLHDPMQEGPGKDKPLVLRRKTRKRAFDECSSSDGESVSSVIVPVASIWVKQSHYPHLLAKELQLQGQVLPGGERYLRQTLKLLKQMDKEKGKDKDDIEKCAEDSEDVDGGPGMPSDDRPGSEQEDTDLDLACRANINLPETAEQAPPSSEDCSEKGSYENVVHSHLQEFHESVSHCQFSDLYKRVADWESRIRPLLDTEEERERFDIRTYSNRVLDHFSNAPSKQTLYFREICRGRQMWEVPRYFIATLQLANNYNVELGTDDVMEEGMDTLHLTLLSRKQNFHELEEFGDNHVSLTNTPEPARNMK
ncbi:condensin-2 complex subunit H2 [Rhipicephalus sanguineus]|uniref:Condensin-2 complex subunit H2 n=1 Tax=Rhipicephalus sanguineus TaxID=34632 RepID=A0A9D4T726_RHISA|nr:condensin-2 complex subunit H2 [Rhipicephalus sanguineus]KAH7981813.1 hypothetical protein HPB52_001168 [Rhipicephalus sanguineus]